MDVTGPNPNTFRMLAVFEGQLQVYSGQFRIELNLHFIRQTLVLKAEVSIMADLLYTGVA